MAASSLLLSPASAVEKKTRTKAREGTYAKSNGKSGSFESQTTREKGRVTREGSATNQDGKTVTSTAERIKDKAAGTSTSARTITGPEGKAATVNTTSTKNSDGTVSTEGTRSVFNGHTSTFASTATKTEDGRTATGTITNAKGQTATTTGAVTHGAGETVKAQTATGANGKTVERVVDTRKNADGTLTRTIEVSGPDGKTATRTETISVQSSAQP